MKRKIWPILIFTSIVVGGVIVYLQIIQDVSDSQKDAEADSDGPTKNSPQFPTPENNIQEEKVVEIQAAMKKVAAQLAAPKATPMDFERVPSNTFLSRVALA